MEAELTITWLSWCYTNTFLFAYLQPHLDMERVSNVFLDFREAGGGGGGERKEEEGVLISCAVFGSCILFSHRADEVGRGLGGLEQSRAVSHAS